jgi:hypothetical protein
MHLNLHLPPEIETKLAEKAAITGKSPETLAIDALREQFSDEPVARPLISPDEWLKQFDAWIASHAPVEVIIDDSRESIYDGRGQ